MIMQKVKEIQNRFAKIIVAKLLGSLEANPVHIGEIEFILAQYHNAILDNGKSSEDAFKTAEFIASEIHGMPIVQLAAIIQNFATTYTKQNSAKSSEEEIKELAVTLEGWNRAQWSYKHIAHDLVEYYGIRGSVNFEEFYYKRRAVDDQIAKIEVLEKVISIAENNGSYRFVDKILDMLSEHRTLLISARKPNKE